jgi:hypothetical protein
MELHPETYRLLQTQESVMDSGLMLAAELEKFSVSMADLSTSLYNSGKDTQAVMIAQLSTSVQMVRKQVVGLLSTF